MSALNTLKEKKIGIVGAGNMGRALALGLISSGLVEGKNIRVSDPDTNQRTKLAGTAGIATEEKNSSLIEFADVVILAVKPQSMDQVLRDIADSVKSNQLVISIAAGVTLKRLENAVGKAAVVRAMPNAPALIGKGISAISGGERATQANMETASLIMGCVGQVIQVPESWMDAITATSGSGPAYVFYFIEALTQAAIDEGISPEIAHKLVIETFAGSVELLKSTGESPQTLRQRVASPGGTTQAALSILDEHKTREILSSAVRAATQRGKELSKL